MRGAMLLTLADQPEPCSVIPTCRPQFAAQANRAFGAIVKRTAEACGGAAAQARPPGSRGAAAAAAAWQQSTHRLHDRPPECHGLSDPDQRHPSRPQPVLPRTDKERQPDACTGADDNNWGGLQGREESWTERALRCSPLLSPVAGALCCCPLLSPFAVALYAGVCLRGRGRTDGAGKSDEGARRGIGYAKHLPRRTKGCG